MRSATDSGEARVRIGSEDGERDGTVCTFVPLSTDFDEPPPLGMWRSNVAYAPLAPLEPPLPILLVLAPTMIGGPWSLAVSRAALTLQLHDFGNAYDLGCSGSLAYAILLERVERVVVCASGHGLPSPTAAAAFDARVRTVERAVRAVSDAQRPTPVVDALWLDEPSRRFFVMHRDASDPAAPCSPTLTALVQPITNIRAQG